MQDNNIEMMPQSLPDPVRASDKIGGRIRAAREASALTQAALSAQLGFADRQTLSAIETGERRVQATELVKISDIVGRPIDWFIDPFVVEGEAQFSWRVASSVSEENLGTFEDYIGGVVGMLRFLRSALNRPSMVLAPSLRVGAHSTFEDARSWGERVAKRLALDVCPSLGLVEAIERELDIPVLFVDVGEIRGISGSMCRLHDLQVIVINRGESTARRNFDVAHELFHALTWESDPPAHRDDPEPRGGPRKRIEQLADNFAAGLLMPRSSLDFFIQPEASGNPEHLAEVARELRVSASALAYRLLNERMIDRPTCEALKTFTVPRDQDTQPKRFSHSFASLLHDGIGKGHVSARKAAKTLSLTLQDLADVLTEHGFSVPFAV